MTDLAALAAILEILNRLDETRRAKVLAMIVGQPTKGK